MKVPVVVLIVTLIVCRGERIFDNDYPQIEELFPKVTRNPKNAKNEPDVLKNFAMDIEKLDMSKFKRKLSTYDSKIKSNEMKINNTRRQALRATDYTLEFGEASVLILKTKIIDVMLQVLYMARRLMKVVEDDKSFNPRDAGFQVSFIHERLKKILIKLVKIYSMMKKNFEFVDEPKKWQYVYPGVLLHHRAVKLHVDFVYMWWVEVRVDAVYKREMKIGDPR